MTVVAISSPTAPAIARRRAGPAFAVAVNAQASPPELAAEPAANTSGSSRRASCQTGIAVLLTSAAVYVASGRPESPATRLAIRPAPPHHPRRGPAPASPGLGPPTTR